MKVLAPGKLVLTGAYAVLEGAPALVVAVDRYAVAHVATPDQVDTRSMLDVSGRKLGLGSSAAWMVAAEAARAIGRGDDLRSSDVRAALFRAVREAHARAQSGGSGVDVAASVHGGALRYTIERERADGEAGSERPRSMHPVTLPQGLAFAAFWTGTSARTRDLRARVDATPPGPRREVFDELRAASHEAAEAVDSGGLAVFIRAARRFGRALEALGRAADVPIVPPAFTELAALAEREQAAFYPSGAGGGDVGVWLGASPPSTAFVARAEALTLSRLDLGFDRDGVRLAPTLS